MWNTKTVTHYRCHRVENKKRPHRKWSYVKPINQRDSRRDRTSRLYDCEFQIKVVEPKTSRYSNTLVHATIYIHSKYSGHNLEFDVGLCFQPVHLHVFAELWRIQNTCIRRKSWKQHWRGRKTYFPKEWWI